LRSEFDVTGDGLTLVESITVGCSSLSMGGASITIGDASITIGGASITITVGDACCALLSALACSTRLLLLTIGC